MGMTELSIPLEVSSTSPPPARGKTHYFSGTGCVVEYPDRRDVFIGGSLVGTFSRDDVAMRNMLIVTAARSEGAILKKLATGFGVSAKTVTSIRQRFEQGGIEEIVRAPARKRKLTPKLKEQLYKLFDQGLTIDEAVKRVRKRISRALAGRAHKQWADERKARLRAEEERKRELSSQLSFEDHLVVEKKPLRKSTTRRSTPITVEEPQDELGLERSIVRGGGYVQHVGCWIMLAMMQAFMFYTYAEKLRANAAEGLLDKGKQFVTAAALRVALDVVAISLIIGENTVEGVRRVATPSAPTLLRHQRAPSPSWARRVLGRYAEAVADVLHMVQAAFLVQLNEQHSEQRSVYYVDNHLRPYTGKFTVRKGWRMQDKRARPGVSDYWVHDEDGRPVMRADSPEHESLVAWLRPIGEALRSSLRDEEHPVLLVFDRAGAHAEAMSALRDAGFEFVTYERKPYTMLPASAFTESVQIGDERYDYCEAAQKNLGKGRGRIRRIGLRSPEGEQFNIIGISSAHAEDLIRYILGRWARQENQFKYGVERWGINQLDGRQVESYPPDAVIPNPARARLDRALRLARAAEGEALRQLERLPADAPKRVKYAQDLERARTQQQELEAVRPSVPKKAALEETELSGKLVKHRRHYKACLDTLRIALANAESDLAARLAPHLPRATEVKKTLKNLLVAPGSVRLNKNYIAVTLSPACTSTERRAFEAFLDEINQLSLNLPGDRQGRRLSFTLEKL